MQDLQPFDAAFLRAGPRAAFILALGDLEHLGAVVVEPGSRRLTAGKASPPPSLHPLPRAVHAAIRRGASTASELWRDDAVVAVLDAIGGDLERRGLVRRRGGRGPAVLLAIAAVACFVAAGAGGGGPSLILGLMCFFGAIAASRGARGGATAEGRRVLRREQERRRPLLERRHETDGADDGGVGHAPWLYALYGWNMGGMYSAPMLGAMPESAGGTFDASASRPSDFDGGGAFAGGSFGSDGGSFDAGGASSDGGSSSSGVESLFGGGESGGGFGGDWSSDAGASGGDSGGGFGGDSGGGGGDGGGGGGD